MKYDWTDTESVWMKTGATIKFSQQIYTLSQIRAHFIFMLTSRCAEAMPCASLCDLHIAQLLGWCGGMETLSYVTHASEPYTQQNHHPTYFQHEKLEWSLSEMTSVQPVKTKSSSTFP